MNPIASVQKDVSSGQVVRVISRVFVVAAALYLAYIGLTCPCAVLYKCHLREMYLALFVVIAVLMAHNEFGLFKPSDAATSQL